MRSPESFDAFYASSRDRLLHEAYALTGDVGASRAAVRDAFAVAWHHWRKVAALEDREVWIRSVAHGRARRRASALFWHRDRSLDDELRRTLDALTELSWTQRHLLVLVHLSPLSGREIARLVALPLSDAQRELETAIADFAEQRGVQPTDVVRVLGDLQQRLTDVSWPRMTSVRRAGTARRRVHTLVGSVLAGAALVVSGSIVASGAGAESTSLAGEDAAATVTMTPLPTDEATPTDLAEDMLLTDAQVQRLGPRLDWTRSSAPSDPGDALVLPCQREPHADPDHAGVLVRSWKGTAPTRGKKKANPAVSIEALQHVERSRDAAAAEDAYATMRNWFAACLDPRSQLMHTRTVRGVGDEAVQFQLRSWTKSPSVVTVGLARSGRLVLTTVARTHSGAPPDQPSVLNLAAAVNRACESPDAGRCGAPPKAREREPFPSGATLGLLSTVDLPPVSAVRGPWVGTDAEPTTVNNAATRCDNTSFEQQGIKQALARTFVFLKTGRTQGLGLTQTVAPTRNARRASAFIEQVRTRVRGCAEANLGTTVTPLAASSTKRSEVYAWVLAIELSDEQTVPYLMSVQREGNVVSQMTFIPDRNMTMSRTDFTALARRALERLSDLEGHKG